MSLSYTTVERIYAQVPILENPTVISSSQVATYAEDAEAEIDATLAGRYEVPISGEPPILRTIATKLTCGLILSQRVFTQERLKDSVWPAAFLISPRDTLRMLASGVMTLVASGGVVVAARNDLSEVWSNTQDWHPTTTELDPTRQIVDRDKIDALEDERDLGAWPEHMLR